MISGSRQSRLKLKKIKAILLDVDGVLTDGLINIGPGGFEFKSFNVRDGHRLKLAMRGGVKVFFITGRQSESVGHRAKELGINGVYQGVLNKVEVLDEIAGKSGISPEEMIYVGDDLVDIPLMRLVGLSGCPEDAAEEVKEMADLIIGRPGGKEAVGRLVEEILKAQGKWEIITDKYM